MGHWLFWYLTWAIWIRSEGVVPINMTETSDIENDVVPPLKSMKTLKLFIRVLTYCFYYNLSLITINSMWKCKNMQLSKCTMQYIEDLCSGGDILLSRKIKLITAISKLLFLI